MYWAKFGSKVLLLGTFFGPFSLVFCIFSLLLTETLAFGREKSSNRSVRENHECRRGFSGGLTKSGRAVWSHFVCFRSPSWFGSSGERCDTVLSWSSINKFLWWANKDWIFIFFGPTEWEVIECVVFMLFSSVALVALCCLMFVCFTVLNKK